MRCFRFSRLVEAAALSQEEDVRRREEHADASCWLRAKRVRISIIRSRGGPARARLLAKPPAWTPAAARRRAEAEAGQYFVTTP